MYFLVDYPNCRLRGASKNWISGAHNSKNSRYKKSKIDQYLVPFYLLYTWHKLWKSILHTVPSETPL